jgi:hypothetical protein
MRDLALVARHDGLEHVVPAVSAVHVAGTQSTAFEVAKLVEHEEPGEPFDGLAGEPALPELVGNADLAEGRPSSIPTPRSVLPCKTTVQLAQHIEFRLIHITSTGGLELVS